MLWGALTKHLLRKQYCSRRDEFSAHWVTHQDQGNFSIGNLQGRMAKFLGNGQGTKTLSLLRQENAVYNPPVQNITEFSMLTLLNLFLIILNFFKVLTVNFVITDEK